MLAMRVQEDFAEMPYYSGRIGGKRRTLKSGLALSQVSLRQSQCYRSGDHVGLDSRIRTPFV